MAVLDGLVLEDAEVGADNPHLTLGLHDFAYLDWPPRESIVTHENVRTAYAYTDHWPVAADNAHALVGHVPISYFDDYYNRVHLNPTRLDLGFVLSTQVLTVDVWNANLVPVTLTDITVSQDGVEITGLTAFPVTYGAIQLSAYEFSISRTGPSEIDADVVWVFTETNDPALLLSGSRVLAWRIPANWADPVKERLSWLTDVERAEDGAEQRHSLRSWPRVAYEFSFAADGRQRRELDHLLYGLGGQPWAVPVWPDAQRLTVPVSAGAMTVTCNTTYKDFAVGDVALLLSEDGLNYEAFQIDSIAVGSLTLVRQLVQSWPAGTWLYPAKIGRMKNPATMQRLTRAYVTGAVTFELDDGVPRTYGAESPTYRGQPVLEQELNWRDGFEATYRRQLARLDTLIGAPYVYDRSALGEPTQGATWTAFGRAELDALRKFLYARAGRFRGLWVPSGMADLQLVSTITDSSTEMIIEECSAGEMMNAQNNRRDLRIELTDGSIFYRRVTATAEGVSADTESVVVDSAYGQTITPAEVRLISWMTFLRLDDDEVELEWSNADVAEASFTLTGPRNDL